MARNGSSKNFSINQPKISVLCWGDYNFLSLTAVSVIASLQNYKDLMDKKRTEFFTDHWVCYQVEITLQIPHLSRSAAERSHWNYPTPIAKQTNIILKRAKELGRTRRRKADEYMAYFSFSCEFKEYVFTH